MGKLKSFLGLHVVTYYLMSNHFHILVEEPDKEDQKPLSSSELLDSMLVLYDYQTVHTMKEGLERTQAGNNVKWKKEILQRYQNHRRDVSIFMKELKQRFTQWYDRRGTLWVDRYKRFLVERQPKSAPDDSRLY